MFKGHKTFFLFATLLLVLIAPHICFADTPDWQKTDCTDMNTALQKAQMSQAQNKSQNTNDFYAYMPPIDLATYNCLKKVDDLMNSLQQLSSLGLGALLDAWIQAEVAQLITQTCNVAVGTLNDVTKLVYSQLNLLCLPLPNIGLNLQKPKIPSGPPCNGTPLINLTPLPATTTNGPSQWNMWGGKKPCFWGNCSTTGGNIVD